MKPWRRWRRSSGCKGGGIPAEFQQYQRQAAANLLVTRFSGASAEALPDELVSSELFQFEVGFSPSGDVDEEIPFDDREVRPLRRASSLEQRWREWVRQRRRSKRPGRLPARVGRNVRTIASAFRLDRYETAILEVAIVLEFCPGLAELLGSLPMRRPEDLARILADALHLPTEQLRSRLADDAPLFGTGLVTIEDDDVSRWRLELDRRIREIVFEPRLDPADVLTRFLPEEKPPTLALEDFEHVPDLRLVADLIRRAHDSQTANVHIGFIGDVGTGKNEAARVVAKLAGARLFLAGAPDAFGGSPSARQRLASLSAAYQTLRGQRAIVVMDEFDDLFGSHIDDWSPFETPRIGPLSKLALNRRMETAPVVTIWICNPGPWLEAAQLRRFTAVVHFKPLGPPQLRGVWERLAGHELSSAHLDGLAHAYPVSPAEIATALRAARLLGNGTIDQNALERILTNAARAIPGRRRAPAQRAAREYLVDAVNASVDLVALADRLSTWKAGTRAGPGLLLHGVSGSGKSEFLHYLARRMGRPVLVKKVSDIESPFLGLTERNIEDACAEAMDADALLVFDEVDSWLRNRAGARYQWEVSISNQFLQSLEAHRGVICLTTNLFDELDPAVMRRMTHRIRFGPVRPDQAAMLFGVHLEKLLPFPLDAASRGELLSQLSRLQALVPGDFGSVARRFAIEAASASLEALLGALEEAMSSRSAGKRPLGFR